MTIEPENEQPPILIFRHSFEFESLYTIAQCIERLTASTDWKIKKLKRSPNQAKISFRADYRTPPFAYHAEIELLSMPDYTVIKGHVGGVLGYIILSVLIVVVVIIFEPESVILWLGLEIFFLLVNYFNVYALKANLLSQLRQILDTE